MSFVSKKEASGLYILTHEPTGNFCHLEMTKEPNEQWHVVTGKNTADEKRAATFRFKREAKDHAEAMLTGGDALVATANAPKQADAEPVVPVREKSNTEIILEQRTRFDAIEAMARMTMSGHNRALIVSGPPGAGKTYPISMLADEYYDNGLIRYHFIKGYMRPLGLYCKLFEFSGPNDVIIVDDCDTVFRDEAGLNILKAALDTSTRRVLSWNTRAVDKEFIETADGEEVQVPRSFEYQGSMIFLTNVDMDKLAQGNNNMAPHFSALMSRAHYIDCGMHTRREMLLRVVDVCDQGGMLANQCGLEHDRGRQVIDFMTENLDSLREISLRTALKIGLLAAGNPEKWVEMAKVTCLR